MRAVVHVVVAILILPAFARAGSRRVPSSLEELHKSVKELRRDISTINLLNGLHLTRPQMQRMLALAREAEAVRASAGGYADRIAEVLRHAQETFAALRTEIQKGDPARGVVPKRARMVKNRLKDLHEQAGQTVANRLARIEARLAGVLTPEQKLVVEGFSPCLIPPPDLRNPVRAGQASSNQHVIRHLRKLRGLPENAWRWKKDRIVARIVDKIAKHIPLTGEDRAEERGRLAALLEEARSLSGVDFEMEKDELARRFKPKNRIQELTLELARRTPGHPAHRLTKIGRFLLHARVIHVLEERLGNMAPAEVADR